MPLTSGSLPGSGLRTRSEGPASSIREANWAARPLGLVKPTPNPKHCPNGLAGTMVGSQGLDVAAWCWRSRHDPVLDPVIFVKCQTVSLAGKTIWVERHESDTIREVVLRTMPVIASDATCILILCFTLQVKQRVHEKEGIPPEDMILRWGHKFCGDKQTVGGHPLYIGKVTYMLQ